MLVVSQPVHVGTDLKPGGKNCCRAIFLCGQGPVAVAGSQPGDGKTGPGMCIW